jgi:lipoyl(octanoyl) transferase
MTDFDRRPVAWAASETPVSYPVAVSAMEDWAARIHAGTHPEMVWLLEHPALYTAGTSARADGLKAPGTLPVFETGRGGQYTYHGPGQRIAYVMLDVKRRFGSDVRSFVGALENWIIGALATLGVTGVVRSDRVGVWVVDGNDPGAEAKIAAIGIRIRRGVSFHGISINVDPDLTRYSGIVPCGISEHGVTSLASLGHRVEMKSVDRALRTAFERVFAVTEPARSPLEGPIGAGSASLE